jgi:hypothetical protein
MKHSIVRSAGLALIIAACLAAGACTRKEQARKNTLPEIASLKFTPDEVRPGESVWAVVKARDLEGDELRIEYQWSVNGTPMDGATGSAFSAAGLAPGDKVGVKVRAVETASGLAGEWKQKTVALGAYPPIRIKGVEISPREITAGSDVEAVIDYGDLDPNDVEAIYYRWNINGKDLEGEDNSGPSLPSGTLVHGDRVSVSVCLDGLFQAPNLWTSATYVVANSSPEFTSTPVSGYDGTNIVIYFQVEDPDGDKLNYSLSGAPPGSYIDQRDGTKVVINTKAPAGAYNMLISATDGFGGNTGKPYTLTIPAQQP